MSIEVLQHTLRTCFAWFDLETDEEVAARSKESAQMEDPPREDESSVENNRHRELDVSCPGPSGIAEAKSSGKYKELIKSIKEGTELKTLPSDHPSKEFR